MKLIDTHAHIYLEEFVSDLAEIVGRAKEKGVDRILLPAIDSTTHTAMLELEERHSRPVYQHDGLASLLGKRKLPGGTQDHRRPSVQTKIRSCW